MANNVFHYCSLYLFSFLFGMASCTGPTEVRVYLNRHGISYVARGRLVLGHWTKENGRLKLTGSEMSTVVLTLCETFEVSSDKTISFDSTGKFTGRMFSWTAVEDTSVVITSYKVRPALPDESPFQLLKGEFSKNGNVLSFPVLRIQTKIVDKKFNIVCEISPGYNKTSYPDIRLVSKDEPNTEVFGYMMDNVGNLMVLAEDAHTLRTALTNSCESYYVNVVEIVGEVNFTIAESPIETYIVQAEEVDPFNEFIIGVQLFKPAAANT